MHQTENCFWLSQAVNDLQLCLSLMQRVFIMKSRAGSPGLRKINVLLAMPAAAGCLCQWEPELLLVLSLQIFSHHCASALQDGFGARRCNFGGVFGSAAGRSAPKEGFSDMLKLPLLKALPNQAMGVGAYTEVVGANAGLSN